MKRTRWNVEQWLTELSCPSGFNEWQVEDDNGVVYHCEFVRNKHGELRIEVKIIKEPFPYYLVWTSLIVLIITISIMLVVKLNGW